MKKVSAKSQFVKNLFLVMEEVQQDCEESKSVHCPSLFQNGQPEFIERYPQAGQLHVQIGSKGCIFLHPTCGGVEEICEIILGGGSISVPVSML